MPDTELAKRIVNELFCKGRPVYLDEADYSRAEHIVSREIAAALSAARAEAYEECAAECDAQAHVEECADDTMRGVENARPYRKMAERFRALAAE